MLKTNLICKAKSLIPAVLIAGCGVIGTYQAANAASLNFVNQTFDASTNSKSYNYTVQLTASDTAEVLDNLVLDNVFGTGKSTNPNWSNQSIANGVKFIYVTPSPTSGPTSLSGFSILAPLTAVDGTRSYSFSESPVNIPGFNNGSLSGNGTVLAPIAGSPTSVPESSNVLGILLVGGLASANQLRKQFVKS